MLKRLTVVAVVIVLLTAGLLYSQWREQPFKVSGFVESDEIRIGSRVGGRVVRILVEEGDIVHKGQPLVELEPFQLYEQQAQARGELSQAQADSDRLKAGYRAEEIAQAQAREQQLAAARDQLGNREEDIAAAKANLDLAESQRELAQLKYDRTEKLFARNSAAQQDMDQATTELRVARATVNVRREELAKIERTRPDEYKQAEAAREEAHQELVLRQAGYRIEDRRKAEAAVETARATLAAIDRQIEELTIRAPVDGSIEAVDLRPGDLVGAGMPAISMIETGRLWVRAYVPENHLDITVGSEVSVTVDSFPGRRFKARASFVARQAEFTPNNIQTVEDRSKQVFRIKVLLEEGLDVLRPGMSGDVWLGGSPP
jgi:multidrug resistance efflux pump